MATYGNFPGVKITTQGGGLTGVQVGDDEKLFIFGAGDPANGTAPTNEPTKIASLSDADKKFGTDTELANAMKQARANGANREYLYGVMLSAPTSVTDEFASAQDHTGASKLSHPLHEDLSTVVVEEDTTSGDGTNYDTTLTEKFRYETNTDNTSTDFTSNPPADANTVFINPLTGEWVADSSGINYKFSYEVYDWQTALDSVDTYINEGETAVLAALSEAPAVHSMLSTKVNGLRTNYQMAQGVAGARPNKTGSDGSYDAEFDSTTYTDNISNDALYLAGPVRFKSGVETFIGALGGLMAGHTITDPIYNDVLEVSGEPTQSLNVTQADNLRGQDIMPVRSSGSIRIPANRSSAYSDQTSWKRDFWRRRIVDRVLLISKMVGDQTVGRINDSETREDAEITIFSELEEMASNRLLKPNTDGETNWRVDVVEDPNNTDQVNVDVGVTPQGIVKQIDQTVTIST